MRKQGNSVVGMALGCALALSSAVAAGKSETVLYSFGGTASDGMVPAAGLIKLKGTLYGTTNIGGSNSYGTIFALDPNTGVETVVHSFGSGLDGQNPNAALINVGGTFYGTTVSGGAGGSGTVFALNPENGAETVVYSFCTQQNCDDGANPYASLVVVDQTLYGVANSGGAYNRGTVFALDRVTGVLTVLYTFCPNGFPCTDGGFPTGTLVVIKNTLYGTTQIGGANNGGEVFAINRKTGRESVVHSFGSGNDGRDPSAGMVYRGGAFYGTTYEGGTHNSGTVFALDRNTGAETVIYSFCSQKNCTDGNQPEAGLIDVKGTLYGTTLNGGTGSFVGGTVFAINTASGAETVLHSFGSGTDGQNPVAGLLDKGGTLYGTTSAGGSYGDGVAFAVIP